MEPQLMLKQRTRQTTMPSIIPMPTLTATPEPTEDHIPESVEILATSQEQADLMAEQAKAEGATVRGTQVWRGPVPAIGSYEDHATFSPQARHRQRGCRRERTRHPVVARKTRVHGRNEMQGREETH